jgi:hypothetical protein
MQKLRREYEMKRSLIVMVVLLSLGRSAQAIADDLPKMTVWKSPWCGCCSHWIDHMRGAGFEVEVNDLEDLGTVKQMASVPSDLQSCHTARVGGYTVEGHVPASDVLRLLEERPDAIGLAVPGMPSGSPGMENGQHDPYDVLLMRHEGTAEVFSSYR